MIKSLFAYIFKHTRHQQFVLMLIILMSFPVYYFSLELPKIIINEAIVGEIFPIDLTLVLFGFSSEAGTLHQIPYLVVLCLTLLIAVLLNGAFKYNINVYRGIMGERILRRMRFELIDRIMRFPIPYFRTTGPGELISMVNQETEPLAGFVGESISLPLYQGGIMATILSFIFIQDWRIGCAAIALYPFQIWLIPKLQYKVNLLNRKRTVTIRGLAERLGETISGIQELHANNSGNYYRSQYSSQLGKVFGIRVQIFKNKFFIKFLNNFLAQITPLLFFLIGGLLVIHGELSFGALVASLAAYKDLSAPWKEMLGWYQRQADARMRYSLLVERFDPEGMFPESQPYQVLPDTTPYLRPKIIGNRLNWTGTDGSKQVDNASLTLSPEDKVILVGSSSSGKETLAHMISGMLKPTSGEILVNNTPLFDLPKMLVNKIIAYTGHDSYVFAGSIRDNLLMGLKQTPMPSQGSNTPEKSKEPSWLSESKLSGNCELDASADWIDPALAGSNDHLGLQTRLHDLLKLVKLDEELIRLALNQTLDPKEHPSLTTDILSARKLFHDRLESEGLSNAVVPLDPDQYNDHSTLAENILFGTPLDKQFVPENLCVHPLIQSLLSQYELTDTLESAAVRTASTLVELFSDLPPGHEYFERFSFIEAEQLEVIKRSVNTISRSDGIATGLKRLSDQDRQLIQSLPYRVILSRHRIDILGDDDKRRIVQIRHALAQQLNDDGKKHIAFFSPDEYNPMSSVAENMMFGRIAFSRLRAEKEVHKLMMSVLRELGIDVLLLELGLNSEVGLGGSRLSQTQRQKIALVRALLKKPKLLIINEGMSSIDNASLEHLISALTADNPEMTLLWIDNQIRFQHLFNRAIFMESGKIVRQLDLSDKAVVDSGEFGHVN